MADEFEGLHTDGFLFGEHNFQEQICDEIFYFKTLKMKDALFIWIGNGPNFERLTVATPSKMTTVPPCTTILGEDVNNFHSPLTQRLAKRLKKQILLSFNISSNEDVLKTLEKRIIDEINKHPDLF